MLNEKPVSSSHSPVAAAAVVEVAKEEDTDKNAVMLDWPLEGPLWGLSATYGSVYVNAWARAECTVLCSKPMRSFPCTGSSERSSSG